MAEVPVTLELILRPEVQRLLDHFATVMKVRTVFFAADGAELGYGRQQAENCLFCRLMQQRYFPVERCRALDAQMRRASLVSRAVECYRCHAGLHEMIAPVFSGRQIAGFIMLGQFRTVEEPPETVAEDAEALAAWRALPLFAEGEIADLKGLFQMLVDYIVARELLVWRGPRRRELVERYLDTHLSGDIRLAQLARFVGCSVSGLTHWLRENFQASFKELLTAKRMTRARELLSRHPEMSIGEVAAAVGYEDPHYFSRIFRRICGCAPGSCRAASERK